ncbi:MAG TPA: zf-HC2 domain-containing protein [Steroidobacteraceae bacterium]|nr:zf-HC2 domain-containing protein [Steroidobacteraceae bacterium]
MSADALGLHEEAWRLLPWLVNGRLEGAERVRIERHVRDCEACARELALQRLWRDGLTAPERVTYAPGPSFRKLMERIDAAGGARTGGAKPAARAARTRAAWRPPGLAWAASFLACVALGTCALTAYRWSQPLYLTHTAPPASPAGVLHLAFDRSLAIGDAERLLLAAGARVVEGPDASGVFGVAPAAAAPTPPARAAQLRALAARLRADARVRWIEPLPRGP